MSKVSPHWLNSFNGLRYRRLGGTRQRHFVGTNLKPRNLPETAQTPTTMAPAYFAGDRVHAVLGALPTPTPTDNPSRLERSAPSQERVHV